MSDLTTSIVFVGFEFLILPALFGVVALPISALLGLMGGQIFWKAIITLITLPAIYLIKDEALIKPLG